MGQVIGGIVAETQAQAQQAAKMVKITYEELPRILTIEVNYSAISDTRTCIFRGRSGNYVAGVILQEKSSSNGSKSFSYSVSQ